MSRFTKFIGLILIIAFGSYILFLSLIARSFLHDQDYTNETITEKLNKNLSKLTANFENKFYDYRMQAHLSSESKNDEIVLMQISDVTLQTIGSWPIPRDIYQKVLLKLKAYGAKQVAFDIFFPEPAAVCGLNNPDQNFVDGITEFLSIDGNKIIIPYTIDNNDEFENFAELPDDLYNFILDSQAADQANLHLSKISKHTYPIQNLIDAKSDLAYINMTADSDGIFRHYQLLANVGDIYVPSLALRTYINSTPDPIKVEINSGRTGQLVLPNKKKLHVNNSGETKIRWIGEMGNFGLINFEDVLNGKDDDVKLKKQIEGKIIFIGSTATGAHDLRHSPVNSVMPGVYAHMNMLHMLMKNFYYQDLEESWKISLIILIAGLLLIIILQFQSSPLIDMAIFILTIAIPYYIDFKFYLPQGYELKLFSCYFTFSACYTWVTFLNFTQANKEKKQIKGTFSRYVAPAIVNEMLDNPEKLKIGGDKKDITCLFSDVRDFTSISEKLTPNELSRALNIYMGAMTDIVFETGGTLDKYIGDAIVAFWGAPLDLDNHPQKAVEAAIKMLEKLPEINDIFKRDGLPIFKIGLGLNSGECSVGNMGSNQIFAYTALGDNMNLGARLESLCKHYGAQILISEWTYNKIDHNQVICRHIDNVKVKGKTEPVGVYEVLYSYHPLTLNKKAFELFNLAYTQYKNKDFQNSFANLTEFMQLIPDDLPGKRLLENSQHYLENPLADGIDHTITTMTSK
jgi:adenylate cyclase